MSVPTSLHGIEQWERLGRHATCLVQGTSQKETTGDNDSWTCDMAEAEFLHYLVDLKATGKASAQDVCVIACWATRAGATGPVQSLAMAPGKD